MANTKEYYKLNKHPVVFFTHASFIPETVALHVCS